MAVTVETFTRDDKQSRPAPRYLSGEISLGLDPYSNPQLDADGTQMIHDANQHRWQRQDCNLFLVVFKNKKRIRPRKELWAVHRESSAYHLRHLRIAVWMFAAHRNA